MNTTSPGTVSRKCAPCEAERGKRRELGYPPGYPEGFGCLHPGPDAVAAAMTAALRRRVETGTWGGTWAEVPAEVRKGPEGGTLT